MAYSPIGSSQGAAHTARLLISCPDGPGIVAAVSRFLFERGANIVSSDQHSTDPEHGTFFMRTAFFLPALEQDARDFEPSSESWRNASTWIGGSPMRATGGVAH